MEEKGKLNPLIPIVILLLVVVAILSVVCFKLFKTSIEYKEAYENLVAEENEAKGNAESYQSLYNSLVYAMLDDAALAETIGNKTVNVWHNAIWNTENPETDKFTKVNGKFVSDFNDALANLFRDADYSADIALLKSKQNQIKSDMKSMLNPPDGFGDAYKALENMYNAYVTFTDIVLNCNGSLESFSNDFGDADEDILRKYKAAELYVR